MLSRTRGLRLFHAEARFGGGSGGPFRFRRATTAAAGVATMVGVSCFIHRSGSRHTSQPAMCAGRGDGNAADIDAMHEPQNSPCEIAVGTAAADDVDMSHFRWSVLDALRFWALVGCHLALHVVKHGVLFPLLRLLRVLPSAAEEQAARRRRYRRIAVVGGGIGGCVAAWALRDTADVTLYEQRPVLGGNAKVVEWPLCSDDGRAATTCTLGTGVLAWPAAYFRHYKALLRTIGHATETVAPRFMVSDDGRTATFRQGAHNEKWDKDQEAWDRFITTVRRINDWLNGGDDANKSIYAISLLNPCNVLPARTVARWHGVSDAFWDTVVVPLYSSSFLTTNMDAIPSVMMPIVDDIITVGKAGGVKELETWRRDSQAVFRELAAQIGWGKVKLNAQINHVKPRGGGGGVDIELGGPVGTAPVTEHYDAVIFACSAPSVDALTYTNTAAQGRTALFNELVGNVEYCDHTDFNFSDAVAHTNERVAIPAALRDEIKRDRYANYVRVDFANRGKLEVENTFVLASWIPDAVRAEREMGGKRGDFFISYNLPRHRETLLDEQRDVRARLTNHWAHPALTTLNQLIAAALRMVQGDNDIYYTGQFACLGTGHDISTTYSVVLATHLGAPYPFDTADKALMRDFKLVQRYMGLYTAEDEKMEQRS